MTDDEMLQWLDQQGVKDLPPELYPTSQAVLRVPRKRQAVRRVRGTFGAFSLGSFGCGTRGAGGGFGPQPTGGGDAGCGRRFGLMPIDEAAAARELVVGDEVAQT